MARKDFPSGRQDQFMVRFPDGMRDRIKDASESSGRSMNAEIIARLEASFTWSDTDLEFRSVVDSLQRRQDDIDRRLAAFEAGRKMESK